jgi:hypothetical protein
MIGPLAVKDSALPIPLGWFSAISVIAPDGIRRYLRLRSPREPLKSSFRVPKGLK